MAGAVANTSSAKSKHSRRTRRRLSKSEQFRICNEQRKKLRQAKKSLEKSCLAKDDFLAALSHELRVPLTPVLVTALALERKTTLPKEVRNSLSMIRRNVELETRLIDDLLDLTRIARGKFELSFKKMDFHLAIHRALEICRSEFSAKSLKIRLELHAARHRSEADPVRLQQALWNLLRNAIKFTPANGSIVVRTLNPRPGIISVEVSDTGAGFEPRRGQKIFQAYEQGGRHVTQEFGGLGLGLTIVQAVIAAHGGQIRASSPGSGKGATFKFEIPLRSSCHAEARRHFADTPAEMAVKRILLVEDHKDTRSSLEFLLRRNKHQVKTAASAREALTLAMQHPFDMVISDIGLPDQSGLALMQVLRDKFGLKGIGLSGYGMEEDIARGRDAGFASYLVKPISLDRLEQAMAEI